MDCNKSSLVRVISILAPTRGATGGMALTGCFLEISILAPTRGATVAVTQMVNRPYYFNPRSHEGSDLLLHLLVPQTQNFNPRSHEGSDKTRLEKIIENPISILAPTRGATKAIGILG